MSATTTALSVWENRCVAPSEVLREVRTNTPVGAIAPVAPHTAWAMTRPRISPVMLKSLSTRPAAIFAEMSVSRTATIATLKDGINKSIKVALGFRGTTNSGLSTPYLLFNVSKSKPRTPSSQSTPKGIDTTGRMTVQGILGTFLIRNQSVGADSKKTISEAGFVSPSVLMDSMMFITKSECFSPGISPHAKLIWFKPMMRATPTVNPSNTEVGMRSM
mmetsp:Transcript_23494/g.58465  ORF Transcript_23494/g.58465 Transcript_23494/m.58465 type:complete len:218 (+) Transcript_23494:933-1586(+)